MSSVLNLPYVCNCGCNYVNGDMFTDYFIGKGVEPTAQDHALYVAAMRVYWSIKTEKRNSKLALEKALQAPPKPKRRYTKTAKRWNKEQPNE